MTTDVAGTVRPCGACGARERYPSGPCRPCTNQRNRERSQQKKDWARADRAANPARAHARDKINRERHADARAEYMREWRNRNPGYHLQERFKKQQRAAYRRWRAKNPDKAREATNRWRRANWAKVLASLQRRRARRAGAEGTFTAPQAKARFDYYGGLCWMCRQRSATAMDHVIALCNGGSNWPANLRPACGTCNGRKGQWEMRVKATVRDILLKARDFR